MSRPQLSPPPVLISLFTLLGTRGGPFRPWVTAGIYLMLYLFLFDRGTPSSWFPSSKDTLPVMRTLPP